MRFVSRKGFVEKKISSYDFEFGYRFLPVYEACCECSFLGLRERYWYAGSLKGVGNWLKSKKVHKINYKNMNEKEIKSIDEIVLGVRS